MYFRLIYKLVAVVMIVGTAFCCLHTQNKNTETETETEKKILCFWIRGSGRIGREVHDNLMPPPPTILGNLNQKY